MELRESESGRFYKHDGDTSHLSLCNVAAQCGECIAEYVGSLMAEGSAPWNRMRQGCFEGTANTKRARRGFGECGWQQEKQKRVLKTLYTEGC